jgi:hypothetical protein
MKLIFGDNQFFGINHMSEEKAQALSELFAALPSIIRVIDDAYDAGIRDFMFTTHDRRWVCLERHAGRVVSRNGRSPAGSDRCDAFTGGC